MQAGRVIAHPHEQDNNKHELEEMREGRGLLQRRLRTAFDDPTWSDLSFRCQWPPHDASTRAELLQGSGEEPSSPPSPPSPSSSPTRGPAAPELEVYVHRVVVAAWSDALAQLCRLQSNNKEEGEIRGGGDGGDGDTTTQDGQQLKLLNVFEKEEEGEPTQRGRRRTVVELQATEPGDPSALRLLLAFLYSGDLAQALDDTAACRVDGSGARSDADHGAVRPHILKSILQDAAGGDDISPADRHTAKIVVARAANLGLGYGVPELHQQFKSSSMWIADTESSPTTPPYHVSADDGLVQSPLDALLAAASQHPLVRADAIPAAESPVTAEVKLGGFQEGRSLRGSTERRVPARYCSPDVEVYKGTWEVRGKRKPAPAPTSPSPASPTSFSPHTSPPTIGRRSARLMEQELTVAETTADVMAATKEAREAADDDSEQYLDHGSSALDAPRMHSVARRSSRRHSGGLERKPSETDTRKKRRKEVVEEVDEEEEEDDDEYDQRHESMRIIANANKKRRAVAKAKQTRESAAAVSPPEDNADEETFALVETNDHPTVDTTIVPSAKSLPAAVLLPQSATELTSPRGVRDVAVVTDQPVVTETQVLAAAAASGQIRRSLKQLRKEHGKNCHNCKTRKIDFVTCLVRPTHRFCDGCLRKLFNVEFANAHAEWDGIVHPEGCAICRHMCPCVGCRKRAHPPASPARNSSDASRKAKRPRDDADATDQRAPERASGGGHCAAGSGDNDDSPRTKKPTESEKADKNEKREEKKNVKEEKKTSSSKRRRTRSLIDGRESTQENESEDRVRRSSLDMHEDEDSVEMMTDADASEHLAAIPPGKSTRSRSKRTAATSTPPHSKSSRSSARRSGGGGGSRSAAKGFNVPEGAGPEAFLGLVSAGSALSQRPTRRTPIRAPSADD